MTTVEKSAEVLSVFGTNVIAHKDVEMMAVTSAALIINECKNWEIGTTGPDTGVLNELYEDLKWDEPVYKVLALMSHVEMVQAYVEMLTKEGMILGDGEYSKQYMKRCARLLSNSLTTFQKWKTGMIKTEEFKNQWGNPYFHLQVWDENVEEFRKLHGL